jgi:septal ring-binding cell division protein DamX
VPTPTPRPAATPRPAVATQASGEGRTLLRQGSFPEAARSFAAALAPGARGRFSHQLLTACAPDTIAKAVQAVTADELFILPVTFQGRSCYRLCWGVYDSRPAAEAALASVPAYFRQGGTSPRLSPLPELLP